MTLSGPTRVFTSSCGDTANVRRRQLWMSQYWPHVIYDLHIYAFPANVLENVQEGVEEEDLMARL